MTLDELLKLRDQVIRNEIMGHVPMFYWNQVSDILDEAFADGDKRWREKHLDTLNVDISNK